MASFGTDFSLRPLSGALLFGAALLQEDLSRLLRTRRGALFYDPEYGSYLPEYLGEGFDDGGAEAAAICELDLEEDPRVGRAVVTVLSADLKNIRLLANLETSEGPFALIVEGGPAEALSVLAYPEGDIYGAG